MAEYLYDGSGVKRQVISTTVNQNLSVANGSFKEPTAAQKASVKTTDYVGNIIYENGTLSMILTGEGYLTLSGTTPTYHYYLKDHQGNNRVVVNQSGTVTQVNHYYPFGGVFGGEGVDTAKQPFKYNDKEFDRTNGLDLYDYSARFMDAALGRFTTVDPLAEKYYGISPYVYCLNSPIRFIDKDGKKVYFAPGVSAQFKSDFKDAVKHLNKHKAAGMLAELHASENIFYINESTNLESRFVKKENTIYWNSRAGLMTNEGIELSPTSILNHEVDHALQAAKNPEQQRTDGRTPDANYGNKEEKRVIEGSEQITARRLNEIGDGEITRKDHGGTLYETKSPIKIDRKEELIIRPENR